MKRVLSMAVGLMVLGAASARALEPYQEESQKSYAASGLTAVSLDNSRGRIELAGSPGDQVVIQAIKIVRGRNAQDARDLASSTRVEIAREGSRLAIRVVYPQITENWNFWNFDWNDQNHRAVRVRLIVRLPGSIEAQARVASGDIVSHAVQGRQTLSSTSGDVRVEDAGGPVDLRSTSGNVTGRGLGGDAVLQTVSGDVRVTQIKGKVDARTTSGSMRLSEIDGPLTVSSVSGDVGLRGVRQGLRAGTTSGDLVARDVTGSCVASVSSGDVDVQFAGLIGDSEVSSASGDVVIRLAPDARCELELRTGSGSIDMRVPLKVRTVSRHIVAGTVGGGGGSVKVRTSSGEVIVAASEGAHP